MGTGTTAPGVSRSMGGFVLSTNITSWGSRLVKWIHLGNWAEHTLEERGRRGERLGEKLGVESQAQQPQGPNAHEVLIKSGTREGPRDQLLVSVKAVDRECLVLEATPTS